MKASQPGDAQQGVGGRGPSSWIISSNELISSSATATVGQHVLEMHIERPFRDSRLANEIVKVTEAQERLANRAEAAEMSRRPRPLS